MNGVIETFTAEDGTYLPEVGQLIAIMHLNTVVNAWDKKASFCKSQ